MVKLQTTKELKNEFTNRISSYCGENFSCGQKTKINKTDMELGLSIDYPKINDNIITRNLAINTLVLGFVAKLYQMVDPGERLLEHLGGIEKYKKMSKIGDTNNLRDIDLYNIRVKIINEKDRWGFSIKAKVCYYA